MWPFNLKPKKEAYKVSEEIKLLEKKKPFEKRLIKEDKVLWNRKKLEKEDITLSSQEKTLKKFFSKKKIAPKYRKKGKVVKRRR